MDVPASSNVELKCVATLKGHRDAITSIATPATADKNFFISGSRDKTAIVWEVDTSRAEFTAVAKRSLHGHNHYVQDVAVNQEGEYALTGSWDKTVRLWNLATGKTDRVFTGHTHDILSVAFSPDNRQIVSGSRDRSIKVWNSRGEIKAEFVGGNSTQGHNDWVSCVRFSPFIVDNKILAVSAGWDKLVKVWDMHPDNMKLTVNHIGHNGYINTVSISPDGTLCASAGKDGMVMLWDLSEPKHFISLDAEDIVNALVFSPKHYWLCAATTSCIKIWDLCSKTLVGELYPEGDYKDDKKRPQCNTIAWSADGETLFAGYTDNVIRVWQVARRA